MAKRKLLKEKDVPFFPVTVSDAVIFEEGKSLDEKIYELEDTIANLPEVPEIPDIPEIPDTNDFMLASVYQDDEEVIAAAFNNLNDRLKNLSSQLNERIDKLDNRIYNNGAILDLTGYNNPNYDWVDDKRVLNEKCFNAVNSGQIGIILDQTNESQVVPLFAVASPLDEYGNALQGKHEFVLMTIPSGNMSEGGRYFEAQSSINWYNAFYGLLIDDSTGVISEIPWSNVQPDTPDEPYEPDEPIDDEPIEPEEES